MSGVEVYENRTGYAPERCSYDIVWGGKKRWSVPYPFELNKEILVKVGLSLRSYLYNEEQFEKSLKAEAKLVEEDEKEKDLMERDMVHDSYRTAVQKPVYFYNKEGG